MNPIQLIVSAENSGERADVYVSHAVNFMELHFTESDITVEKIAETLYQIKKDIVEAFRS